MKRGRLVVLLIGIILVIGAFIVLSSPSGYKSVSSLLTINKPSRVTVEAIVTNYWVSQDNKQIILVLSDDKASVLALYDLEKFIGLHGRPPGDWMIGQKVVVQGTYYPQATGPYIGYIEISEMLKGCHESYKAPKVRS